MARILPITQAFAIARQATEEATQRIFVQTAKREHSKVMRTEPRPVSFTRFVDGKQGAPEESVKPGGNITYTYPRLELVVQYAMEVLFDLSPVLSGEYRNSHRIYLNGAPVSDLRGWRGVGEIVITNTVPYSRKIEMGVMKMRVPGSSRVYDRAERKVRARYGNMAKIYYTFRGVVSGGISVTRAGNKSDARFPALVIREL